MAVTTSRRDVLHFSCASAAALGALAPASALAQGAPTSNASAEDFFYRDDWFGRRCSTKDLPLSGLGCEIERRVNPTEVIGRRREEMAVTTSRRDVLHFSCASAAALGALAPASALAQGASTSNASAEDFFYRNDWFGRRCSTKDSFPIPDWWFCAATPTTSPP